MAVFNSNCHNDPQQHSHKLRAPCAVNLTSFLVFVRNSRPCTKRKLERSASRYSRRPMLSYTSAHSRFTVSGAPITTSSASGSAFPSLCKAGPSTTFIFPPPFPSPLYFQGMGTSSSSDAVADTTRSLPAFSLRGTFDARPLSLSFRSRSV